jgi:hypothetical protein
VKEVHGIYQTVTGLKLFCNALPGIVIKNKNSCLFFLLAESQMPIIFGQPPILADIVLPGRGKKGCKDENS